jgi:hypothetical protein
MLTFTGGEGISERLSALNFLPVIESEVIRGIRLDTQQGKDAGGSSFAEYTKQYAKYGRLRKGLPVSPVNLRVKSEDSLLDSLGAERIDEKHSVISVKSEKEKIAEGLSKKRLFMGVSNDTVTKIEAKLEDEFARMMQ